MTDIREQFGRFVLHNNPAYVALDDDSTIFVRDAGVNDGGWLRVITWADEVRKYPPHRVLSVRHAETEIDPEPETSGMARLTDDVLRRLCEDYDTVIPGGPGVRERTKAYQDL